MGIFPWSTVIATRAKREACQSFPRAGADMEETERAPHRLPRLRPPGQAALFFSPSVPNCPIMADSSSVVGSPAAVTITMRLRDGFERQFSSWHAEISTAAAGLAGFI